MVRAPGRGSHQQRSPHKAEHALPERQVGQKDLSSTSKDGGELWGWLSSGWIRRSQLAKRNAAALASIFLRR